MKLKPIIAGLALSTLALINSCQPSKTDKEYLNEGILYRDSVYHKDKKVFFDNGYYTDIESKPKVFYAKWKRLNDSLNTAKALELYKKASKAL